MLRLAVLVLLLANAVYFSWSQGLLASWGFAPTQQSEPQRLEQQLKPEAVRVLNADEVRRIELAASTRAPDCLMAGPLEEAQIVRVKQALGAWPAGSWSVDTLVEPSRWIIYMGKYPTAESLNRKKAELRQLGISFDGLSNEALEPGLSLGSFGSEADANRQLEKLGDRGVHTARVVQERAEVRGQVVKLPTVDDTLRARLDELKPALGGKNLRACR
jgi:hypothetical protein